MTKKELMIKAHKMTKEIKNEYPTVDYKFQLGLCLAYLYEEGEKKMEKAISLLDQIQHKYDMNLTEEELKAIIQYAYDKMKQEAAKNE